MSFIEFNTPEGRIVINKENVIAVYETHMDGLGCRIQTGESKDSVFNIIEDYDEVLLWL